jgi:hypothetical protein
MNKPNKTTNKAKFYKNNKNGNKRTKSVGSDFNPRQSETEYGTDVKGRNDLILKDAQMLKDIGSPSFSNPIGYEMFEGYNLDPGCTITPAASSKPGVLTAEFYYGPGYANNKKDPLNSAANKIWNELRKGISGSSRKYGAADLMMSIQAIDSCYVMVNYIQRFFGIYRRFKQKNAYTPQAFFDAAFIDYDGFAEKVCDWRSQLNLLIASLDIFKIPAAMQLLIRHSSMVSNIWMDGADDRCQYYWMIPAGYYTWEDETDPNGSRLVWHWLHSHHGQSPAPEKKTIGDLLVILEDMIDHLYNSTALIDMTGDIEKAFPGATTYISPLKEDYAIEPQFHDSWLFELQNADVLSPYTMHEGATGHFDVYQDEDGLLHSAPGFACTTYCMGHPQFNSAPKVMTMPSLLNIGNNSPTPEIVVENCQWKVTPVEFKQDAGNDEYYFIANYQSEILTAMWIVQNAFPGDGSMRVNISNPITTCWDSGETDAQQLFLENIKYAEFTYHPIIRFYQNINSEGDIEFTGFLGDTRNIALIETSLIAKQHRSVLMALYSLL